ncbi:MAG: hypothetical protein ABIB43_06010 [archaeon]
MSEISEVVDAIMPERFNSITTVSDYPIMPYWFNSITKPLYKDISKHPLYEQAEEEFRKGNNTPKIYEPLYKDPLGATTTKMRKIIEKFLRH